MRWLVALAIACGARPVTHAPPHDLPIPGLRWITPAQPYRVDGAIAIGVDGDRAIVSTSDGVATLDLATGALGSVHEMSGFYTRTILPLDAHRWLAVGYREGSVGAATLDATTLAATPIPLHPVSIDHTASPHAAMMADGSVVITGTGLPLASYDPVTWQVRRTFDPTLSWREVAADVDALYAVHAARLTRFDLATGQQKEIGTSDDVAAGGAAAVHLSLGHDVEILQRDKVGAAVDKGVDAIAIDAAGKRLATLARGVLRLRALPSGKLLASFTLGAGFMRRPAQLVFAGDRVAAVGLGAIRVVDLAAGTTTPAGRPPFGPSIDLAVRDDGAVLDIGDQVWRLVDGRVTATATPGGVPLALPPGELRRFADLDVDNQTVTLRAIDDASSLRTWKVGQASSGWLGDTGDVAVAVDFDGENAARLLRSSGTEVVPVVMYAAATGVVDVDVDGGIALIVMGGAAHVVTLADGVAGATLRGPGCSVDAAAIQRGGKHVAIAGGNELAVWTRTGEPVASVATGETVSFIKFVPGRQEIAIEYHGRGLALWDFARGELRKLELGPSFSTGLSPDGHVVAFAFTDGRVAVADLDALRAALPVTRAENAAAPGPCDAPDPLDIPPDEQAHPVSDPPPGEIWIPDPE